MAEVERPHHGVIGWILALLGLSLATIGVITLYDDYKYHVQESEKLKEQLERA